MHGDAAIVTGAYPEVGEQHGKRCEYHERLTALWMKTSASRGGGVA
jgi:hypothetical protein